MAQPDYRARAAAGIRALQRWYAPRGGQWKTTGWWQAANALTAVIGYTRHTGDPAHTGIISATFTAARRQHADFVNWFFDDSAWWALAWVAAYDLTGEDRYLAAARTIFAHNLDGWDSTCGGGVWWNKERSYKNAITNELFLTLAARLHQRVPGDQDYLAWAMRAWEWLHGSGMIGPDGLVNDGLTADCANNGGTTWTYNQGVILGGLAALYEITGDPAYLRQGEIIADAALSGLIGPSGILAEPCEAAGCDSDQTQFKGIFVRNLHAFSTHGGKPAYRAFLLANADSVWDNDRNAADQFGLRWAGPFDRADASRQSSALEVLTAAAALTAG
ncbi:MAG TPA: glycoside hydrolase family 76 protein [Streptosporangiaceae bacterium]